MAKATKGKLLSRHLLLFFTLALTTSPLSAATTTAYPDVPGTTASECFLSSDAKDNMFPMRREVYDNGRIIDITHRITSDLPAYETMGCTGGFLSLPISMKNGSLYNYSEMKLPVHTGTHVDAPGHVFDHYFDAGFDVDTLDLEVLNV